MTQEGYITRDIGKADDLAYYLAGDSRFSKQTMAIPENVATVYFGEAIRIVEHLHEDRHLISRLYKEFINQVKLRGRNEEKIKVATKQTYKKIGYFPNIELDHTGIWLASVRGACYTVISAFSGC
ncbi:site-specific integrase, partial [Vibrio anguillarum]|nr:site-specific integrase [Vibrio anguillarum]